MEYDTPGGYDEEPELRGPRYTEPTDHETWCERCESPKRDCIPQECPRLLEAGK